MEFLMAIGQYEFLQKALFTSVVVGLICGVIGSFIILRGMSLMGDAISHAVLPGVALSYAFGINFFIGAVLTGVLTAVGIGYVSQNSRIKNDTAIGILFTSAFALGIIMVTMLKSSTDLYHILFGNVLAVRSSDMWVTVGIGFVVIVTVFAFFKELLLTSFDPTIAAAYGLRNNLIHYLLMTLLTMVTVASLQTVGIVLVVAMLITPAATAYLLTDRLSIMIFLAGGFGMLSAVIGLYFSFTYNLASGATIVVVATVLFFLAFLFSRKYGVVWKSIRARQKRVELSK
ncbi:metal ABC transporter permease [Brevibacillus porteri]|uniref:Manganese ABC transporter permease n=1 Tax=Brevibacillus porteri TaxID=2126350 RepID=A0ABX5FXC1_9BACL|nr:metal ABC transporter permease [Brevibacillus porteri]MED1797787.1 metal ABC transporter permease [Brevibacillus porteri]MED2130471.1 metal ABC transporter permease [Brevibacillus porteri]MED2745220.1 metal ABC transporter permease [Brevibacillus porteri]MED2812711.1 metal ABC transporter permease [Brevibacillus porteri]MED2895315.1 metal ABC transporter permease [Brevibacillus porteri]